MSEKMCIHGFPIEFSPRVVQKVLSRVGCPSCLAEKVAMLESALKRATDGVHCPGCDEWRLRAYAAERELDVCKATRAAALSREKEANRDWSKAAFIFAKTRNEITEIYAGMEGFEPQTAPEAYCLRIIEKMYKTALRWEVGDE